MQRASINVSCARAVKELYFTQKELFSVRDIERALTTVGRGGTTTRRDYMGPDGYLAVRGFLERVQGGWRIPPTSMKGKKIEVLVPIGNEYLLGEVTAAVYEALRRFEGITSTITEV